MFKRIGAAFVALALSFGSTAAADGPYADAVTREIGYEYEFVAAGQTDEALGATGAAGDVLRRLICDVSTAATSTVEIQDGADTAITILENNVGSGVGTYAFDLGIASQSGAWSVTTGAGVECLAIGLFTD